MVRSPESDRLTSPRSPRALAVRRLHRRTERTAEQRFVVEGPQAVREALAAGALLELYECGGPRDVVAAAAAAGVPVTAVAPAVLSVMAETVAPQGLVGVAALLDVRLDRLPAGARLVAVLDAVADPGNAGTVIRTADAAGADAVVLTAGSVDPHNGKCVRASAGSLWHVPLVCGEPVLSVMAELRGRGLTLLATSGTGTHDLDALLDADELAGPTAWVFGTEAHGLSNAVLAAADRTVRIPLRGRAESLNLAAAAAICLYASARSHRVTTTSL